jgi:hypothetical protein
MSPTDAGRGRGTDAYARATSGRTYAQVIAIARPDPADGVYTYVDPRTTVVEEHSGEGRSVTPRGGATVRTVINSRVRPSHPTSLVWQRALILIADRELLQEEDPAQQCTDQQLNGVMELLMGYSTGRSHP